MNRIIYLFEVILFLLPVSSAYILAFYAFILIPLLDLNRLLTSASLGEQMNVLSLSVVTILCGCSIFSLWFSALEYIDKKEIVTFSKNPYIFTFIVIGIIISFAAIYEIYYFGAYILGVLACVPALHMLVMCLSKPEDKKITKITLVILALVCFIPGALNGISHLANESGKYYCKSVSGAQSYERYKYPSHTFPDKSKCKRSLMRYQTWVSFLKLLFRVPLVIISTVWAVYTS